MRPMNESEIFAYFTTDRNISPVLRALAIPLSIACLLCFSTTLHQLMFEEHSWFEGVYTLAQLAALAFLFWPFSYVAIKGKAPRTWHPYI